MPSNLALRDGSDPTQGNVDGNGNYADDPEHPSIVDTVESEDDSENNTTEVTSGASHARDDA